MTATDPTPAPGISEERLAEIERLTASMFYGDSVMVEVGMNLARASRELLAEVRRLQQQVERVWDAAFKSCCPHEDQRCGVCTQARSTEPHDEGCPVAAVHAVRRALGSSHG